MVTGVALGVLVGVAAGIIVDVDVSVEVSVAVHVKEGGIGVLVFVKGTVAVKTRV